MSEYDTVRLYTIRVMGPAVRETETVEGLGAALLEAEENISKLLPEGYYVKIEEWDHE
jgi:hypothetical protein